MNCSTPSFPVFHYLPEFAQTQVHWVNDAIQPSHPLSPPSLPALNLSKHQGLLMNRLFTTYDQGIGASASVPPMNIQGWFPLEFTGLISLQSMDSQRSSPNHSSKASIICCCISYLSCVTHGHKFSSLKEHLCIISQLYKSEVGVGSRGFHS